MRSSDSRQYVAILLCFFLAFSLVACAEPLASAAVDPPPGCQAEAAARGKAIFAQCSICHSLDASVGHGTGPNLSGVYGRPVGKVEGFKFSPALRAATESWTHEQLDQFLASPAGSYPGSRMAFAGIPSPASRSDVICFLADGDFQ